MQEEAWHTLTEKEIFKILNTSRNGLNDEEASKRLSDFGKNEIVKEKKKTVLQIFLEQFKSFLIIILLIACFLSFLLGEYVDGLVILLILIANATLGFVQEFKAEKALEALKKMISHKAIVIREGKKKVIPASDLVPGDVIFLEEGERVPADARIIEAHNLKVDESILTGESLPVLKISEKISKEVPLAEMKNMVFMNTHIVRGDGKAVVVATGMNTQIGKIAKFVEEEKSEKTPLQIKLEKLGKDFGIIILFIVSLIYLIGLYKGIFDAITLLIVAISLSISAIPEGLPAVITLTLALGIQEMAKRRAIVRKLMAVETLGATSVICTDKTGTLTKNEITVKKIFAGNKIFEVSGEGYNPKGKIMYKNKKVDIKKIKELEMLILTGIFCNHASLEFKDGAWKVVGDPLEGSLLTLANKAGYDFEKYKSECNVIEEIPFTSERKMMSVIAKYRRKFYSFVKGAPEKILEKSNYIMLNGKILKLTGKKKEQIKKLVESEAKKAYRLLAFAFKKTKSIKIAENDLIFLGFVGMIDPPRPEVPYAIQIAKKAGINVVMITGDHKNTAVAIAKQIGIMGKNDLALDGLELEGLSEKELEEIVEKVKVYARVSPEQKMKILQALEAKGHTVAMTGDGVNDAPALKRAHIGVSMGIRGTDVAKEASDMILEDDNFSTIVNAIKKGREIYDNIRKFIRFELSANFSEVFIIMLAAIADLPLPLLPLQILWINLITDTLPATMLAIDPPEKDILKRPPRRRGESIFARGMLPFLIATASIMCFNATMIYLWGLQWGIQKARTLVFTTSVMFQLFLVFNCRSERKSLLQKNPFENKYLIFAVITSFFLQLLVIYHPTLQEIFGTFPLDLYDWSVVLPFAALGLALSPALFYHEKSHKFRNKNSK